MTTVKERGILFSAPMVRALLAGTKTQTRRAVRCHPDVSRHARWLESDTRPGWWAPCNDEIGRGIVDQVGPVVRCPYGVPGDRLYVKETFTRNDAEVWYRADFSPRYGAEEQGDAPGHTRRMEGPWTSPLFMPRALSRITLEITSVGVERVWSITEEDAKAEGIRAWSKDGGRVWKYAPADREGDGPCWPWVDCPHTAHNAFVRLWCEINGVASWDANPWVWVVGFKRVDAEKGGA